MKRVRRPAAPRPKNKRDWNFKVRQLVKRKLKVHKVSYLELTKRLALIGVKHQSVRALRNRINRGTFSAVFLLQVLHVVNHPPVDETDKPEESQPSTPRS